MEWPPVTGDGEGMFVPISIESRADLTKREARLGGKMWREAVRRYPKAQFLLSLLGFDNDPREIWDIPVK